MQPPLVSVGEVNKALSDAGYAERLAKGKGCYYFKEGNANFWPKTEVHVLKVHDLSVSEWLEKHTLLRLSAELAPPPHFEDWPQL